MTPQAEWPAVEAESSDLAAVKFTAVLAGIPALARFVGGTLIGGYAPVLSALIDAVLAYGLSFAVVFAVAFAVDLLAPNFDGQRNYSCALRLTAYSFTPVWLAGIFLLVPGASFLVLLGLYGLYPMWTGVPVLMRTPVEKALPYVVAIAMGAVVIDVAARVLLLAVIKATP